MSINITKPKIKINYRLTLSIGINGELSEVFPINELVEDWEVLTGDQLENALLMAWRDWAANYIDGDISLVD